MSAKDILLTAQEYWEAQSDLDACHDSTDNREWFRCQPQEDSLAAAEYRFDTALREYVMECVEKVFWPQGRPKR